MPFSRFFPEPPDITTHLFSVFLDLLLSVLLPLSIPSILELFWPLSFSMFAHHWSSIIKMAWDVWPLRHMHIMTQFDRAWEPRARPRFPQTPSFLILLSVPSLSLLPWGLIHWTSLRSSPNPKNIQM